MKHSDLFVAKVLRALLASGLNFPSGLKFSETAREFEISKQLLHFWFDQYRGTEQKTYDWKSIRRMVDNTVDN